MSAPVIHNFCSDGLGKWFALCSRCGRVTDMIDSDDETLLMVRSSRAGWILWTTQSGRVYFYCPACHIKGERLFEDVED